LWLAERLQGEGIDVLTYDPRGGTGRNTYGERESGDLASAVAWMYSEKKFSPAQVMVLGHSMGGAAAISYASRNEVGAVLLISSVYDLSKTRWYIARDYHLFLPSLYANGAHLVERLFFGLNPENPADLFSQIAVPVFILHGEEDYKASIEDVRDIQARYADDSRVKVITVPGAGHTYFAADQAGIQRLGDEVSAYTTVTVP
jgi:pimeloyl-ACP methyl ester carboxylesterase